MSHDDPCSSYTATHPTLAYMILALRGYLWNKLQALRFHGKAYSAMEALVDILFYLYKQTTVTRVDTVLAKITRARSENDLTLDECDDVVIKNN